MFGAPWFATLVALLFAHTVFGKGIVGPEVGTTEQPYMAPADAIVEVAFDAIDADHDGQIALSELESYVDGFYRITPDRSRPVHPRTLEAKSYTLFLAKLIDINRNGSIDAEELRSSAAMLVDVAGEVQVGRAVELEMMASSQMHSYDPEDKVSQIEGAFMEISDTDTDGSISLEELEASLIFQGFRWIPNNVHSAVESVNTDGDPDLNQSETGHLLRQLATQKSWVFSKIFTYCRTHALAGPQIARGFAETRH